MLNNFDSCVYTHKHRVAFQLVAEKILLGKDKEEVLKRAKIHDMDKMVLYLYWSKKDASNFHRDNSSHHLGNKIKKSRIDYLEMIIDWECARYTKLDKPLNAYDTLYKFYPEYEVEILPLLKELKLDVPNTDFDSDILNEINLIDIVEEYKILDEVMVYLTTCSSNIFSTSRNMILKNK